MTAFATVLDYQVAYPGTLTDAQSNARASAALEAACDDIRRYCAQTFTLVEDDEITVNGTGRSTLLLPELPVVAINTVTIDAGLDSELILETTDYRVDTQSGLLYRPRPTSWDTSCWWYGRWPLGFLNVTVDYDHGYDPIPQSLINVAVQLAHETVSASPSKLRSETIAGYSYTQDAGQTSVHDYARVLDSYKAQRIPVA